MRGPPDLIRRGEGEPLLSRLRGVTRAAEYILMVTEGEDRLVMLGCLADDLRIFRQIDCRSFGEEESKAYRGLLEIAAKIRIGKGRSFRQRIEEEEGEVNGQVRVGTND